MISSFQSLHPIINQENILLDAEFHCQITDFGLTRHAEATVARFTKTFVGCFAAPELLSACRECGQPKFSGCHEGHDVRHRSKTTKTEIFVESFAAPELLGACDECGQPKFSSCCEGHDMQHRSKTTKTDVYAFGCLYYAV